MTKNEASLFVTKLMILWPNYKPIGGADMIAETWSAVLGDVSLPLAVEALVTIARRRREFAPDPGLVLDTIRELTGQRYPMADEALAEVDAVIKRVGYTAGRPPEFHNGRFLEPIKPEFSCDPIRLAVEAVGWRDLCLTSGETRSVVRATFLRLYREIADRASLHAATAPLTDPRRRLEDGPALVELPRVVNE